MLTIANASPTSTDGLSLHDSLWRKKIEEEVLEEEEETPTHINTTKSLQFLVVSTDKLSAKYTGDGNHGHDVGAVQGNRPAPVKRTVYYFEINVKDRGLKGAISIGFTDENFKTSRQPGWEPNTYGYHGDDGYFYHGHGKGEPFGPTFTTGDTVGAGINYASQQIFFTKNGKPVGCRVKDVKYPLYPSVGLHSPNERVEINFGQRPFVYDIEAVVRSEHDKQQKAIDSINLPFNVSHSVVRAYLLHYGYQETLTSFDAACGNLVPPVVFLAHENGDKMVDDECHDLDNRRKLRELIRTGDVDGAIQKLHEWYPHLPQSGVSQLNCLLKCQKFIELIKGGSLEAAVKYAQAELASFFGTMSPLYQNLLQDCIALLAYERPAESPVGYLLTFNQREAIADAVNAAVLCPDLSDSTELSSQQSTLERLLRQLTAAQTEKWLLNGSQGEMFRLHRALRGKDGVW